MHPPNRLLDLRQAAGMSQRDVAIAVGVDRTTVARWEARTAPVADKHKLALAALFGVTPAHLMCWGAAAA